MNLTKLTNKKLNTASKPSNSTEAVQIVMPFILKGAKRWARNHFNHMDDLVMAGVEGALEAYKRYAGTDFESKGYRYSSYAYFWVKAKQKEYAEKLWGYLNNTASIPEDWAGNTGDCYEIDTDLLDLKRAYEALMEGEQKIVLMRAEGETFDTIAEQLGYNSLHQARNDYLRVSQRLAG